MADQRLGNLRVGWRPLLMLPIVTGVVAGLATLSDWTSWLAPLCLVPIGLVARVRGSLAAMYLGAWLGGLTFFLPGLWWVCLAASETWMGWLALSAYCALYFPAFLLSLRLAHRRFGMPLTLAVPVAWVATEYARLHLLSGFGWLLLAHSVYRWSWTIQIAELGGVLTVSFLLAATSGMLLELLTQPLVVARADDARLDPTRRLRWRVGAVMAAWLATWAFGAVQCWRTPTEGGPSVLLVHTAVPQAVRNEPTDDDLAAMRRRVVEPTLKESAATLAVWPETTYAGAFFGSIAPGVSDAQLGKWYYERSYFDDPKAAERDYETDGLSLRHMVEDSGAALGKVARRSEKTVVACLIRHVFDRAGFRKYNASVLVSPEAGPAASYDKVHLVPFGEFTPFADAVPAMRVLSPYPAGMRYGLDFGSVAAPLTHDEWSIVSLICFEDTVPHLARASFRAGRTPPTLLVNHSNDGWFVGSGEAETHLAAAIFRCVELRRPMVRSTNLGVTCRVDSAGIVRERLPQREDGALAVQVPLDGRHTLYVAWGDWLPIGCLAVVLAALAVTALDVAIAVARRLRATAAKR